MEKQPVSINEIKKIPKIPENHEVLRKVVLEQYLNRTEGLNIEQVNAFFKEHSIPLEDYICLFDDDYFQLLKDLEIDESQVGGNLELNYGVRLPGLSLTLVRRNRILEEINGTIYTEGTLVHELAHGSSTHSSYDEMRDYGPDYDMTGREFAPRTGFSLMTEKTPFGSFLEEGFAEYFRGLYVKNTASDLYKEKLLKTIGVKDPPSGTLEVSPMVEADGWEYSYPVPAKYFYQKENMKLSFPVATTAAVGIELLIKKSPELFESMLVARTKIDGLREIPKILNALVPDLYVKLRQVGYSSEGFMEALKIIIDELYGGKVMRNENKEII